MSDTALVERERSAAPEPGRAVRPAARFAIFSWMKQGIVLAWKYLVGALLCFTLPGSLLVVGWSYRLAQRSAYRQWWRASPTRRPGEPFGRAARADELLRWHVHWPNWIVHPLAGDVFRAARGQGWARQGRAVVVASLGSCWLNLRIGVGAIFNTWVLTLPGCMLWLFAWYDGWNNSFNKGYEQAHLGPLMGLSGIALFIGAMFYVPLAQARQAVTGHWRRFYDFRLIWTLIKRRRRGPLLLASLYSMLSLPLIVLKTLPGFFPQLFPGFEDLSAAQVARNLTLYFLASCGVMFPFFVLLRVVAARIYAKALLACLRDGSLEPAALAPSERAIMEHLALPLEAPSRRSHPLIRAVSGTWRVTTSALLVLLLVGVWWSFVAQIFASEFLNYHLAQGWLNQPLVQLPWFNYIPGHLTP
jgi:hypothetical protein